MSAETRERGQVCCGFKGRSGGRTGAGEEASLVEDFGGSVGTSGLDNLLLWPRRLVLLRLALAHVDDHAGGGLCPRVELVLFTWKGRRRGEKGWNKGGEGCLIIIIL